VRVPPLGLSDGAGAIWVKTSIALPCVSACYSARLNWGFLLAAFGPNYIRAYPFIVVFFMKGMRFFIHCWQANSATQEGGLNEIFLPRKSRKHTKEMRWGNPECNSGLSETTGN